MFSGCQRYARACLAISHGRASIEMNSPHDKSSDDRVIEWIIIGLALVIFAAIAIPNFIKARSASSANACINNLRQIDAAANQFALEKGKTKSEVINYANDLTPYLKFNSSGKIPPCPAGGTYYIGKVGDTPSCSLSNTPGHTLP
jgi:hypothetical protein